MNPKKKRASRPEKREMAKKKRSRGSKKKVEVKEEDKSLREVVLDFANEVLAMYPSAAIARVMAELGSTNVVFMRVWAKKLVEAVKREDEKKGLDPQ